MTTPCLRRTYQDIHAQVPPWQQAVRDGEALIAEWEALPLRDRAVVKDRLQAIVASLAAVVIAGHRLDDIWSGSGLDTLVNTEVARLRVAQTDTLPRRKTA
jgi:hypothetical protein